MLNWLRRFLYGRYGVDQLSVCLCVAAMLLTLGGSLFRLWPLALAADLVFLIVLLRVFSRNREKRAAENRWFLKGWLPVKAFFLKHTAGLRRRLGHFVQKYQDSAHRYYRCPACKKELRVPAGRGKIEITCPFCGKKFIKKT